MGFGNIKVILNKDYLMVKGLYILGIRLLTREYGKTDKMINIWRKWTNISLEIFFYRISINLITYMKFRVKNWN